jgi:hypothetical protein
MAGPPEKPLVLRRGVRLYLDLMHLLCEKGRESAIEYK